MSKDISTKGIHTTSNLSTPYNAAVQRTPYRARLEAVTEQNTQRFLGEVAHKAAREAGQYHSWSPSDHGGYPPTIRGH